MSELRAAGARTIRAVRAAPGARARLEAIAACAHQRLCKGSPGSWNVATACELLLNNPMRVVLTIDGRKVEVTRSETLVGRTPECDIVLPDRGVSRTHAAIVMTASGVVIRDLSSRNGTWVNGLRVGTDRRLRIGDRIRLGSVTFFVTDIGDSVDRDDGWLVIQAAQLVTASTAERVREADEILFRLAEVMETRLSLEERFGDDVLDAVLAAVIDYATARQRPGWIRWAMGVHAKLGLAPGSAVRRALENIDDPRLRSSGLVSLNPSDTTVSTPMPPMKKDAG